MPSPRSWPFAVSFLVLLTSLAAQSPEGVSFVDGDLGKLKARLVKAVPMGRKLDGKLLEIEVRNRSRVSVEPLVFTLETGPRSGRKGTLRSFEVARVPLPHFGRAGRAIGPGKALRFRVLSPLPADSGKPRVRVSAASFFKGKPAKKAPVQVLDKRFEKLEEFGQVIPCTVVKVRNTADAPLDAIFLATYSHPMDAQSLVRVRLAARETKEWTISRLYQRPEGGEIFGATIQSLKPLDWSLIASDGAEVATRRFVEAWKGWRGTERRPGTLTGSFDFSYREASKPNAPNEAQGRFELSPTGDVTVEITAGTATKRGMISELKKLFYAWVRPTAAELVETNSFRLARADAVVMDGPLWDRNANQNLFVLDGRRITRRTSTESPGNIYGRWITEEVPGGWILTGIDFYQKAMGEEPNEVKRWRHRPLKGLHVPAWHQRQFNIGGKWYSTTETKLDDLKLEAEAAMVARTPEGPLAQRVEALWNGSYRYPERAVRLSGRFEVVSPATDGLWQGKKSVTGRFVLEEFRGMLMTGKRWKKARFDLDGEMSPDMKSALAGVVEDRFRMWAFRDWAGRHAFEEEFKGATILEGMGAAGGFDLKDAAVFRGMRVAKDGSLHLRLGEGLERVVTFQEVGGARVPRSIRTGGETLSARFRDFGDGWILPVEMRFEKVFGDDWGPEVLSFTELKIAKE